MYGGCCGISFSKQQRLAVLRGPESKPVTCFLTVFKDPGVFPTGKWNTLVRTNVAMRVAEGDNKLLFFVDSYTRSGLYSLAGQISVCCSLRVSVNLSGCIFRLTVILQLKSTCIVFTGLLGMSTEM